MSIFTDILKEIPLSAVLRERLAQAESKMSDLQKENEALKSEITGLKAENAVLKTKAEDLQLKLLQSQAEIENLRKPQGPSIAFGSNPKIDFF